jgi:hypothetical protein
MESKTPSKTKAEGGKGRKNEARDFSRNRRMTTAKRSPGDQRAKRTVWIKFTVEQKLKRISRSRATNGEVRAGPFGGLQRQNGGTETEYRGMVEWWNQMGEGNRREDKRGNLVNR